MSLWETALEVAEMLVVHCQGEPNETERAMARVLEGDAVPGLLLVNYRLPGLEVDGLVITPDRVCCIEAKGLKDLRGELVPRLNGPWTVGDEPVQFAGGSSNPGVQARKQAQQLKRYLVDRGLSRYFVPSIVAVDGPDISCPPTSCGTDQIVTELARLPEAVAAAAGRTRINPEQLDVLLAALEVEPLVEPHRSALHDAFAVANQAPRPPRPATRQSSPRPVAPPPRVPVHVPADDTAVEPAQPTRDELQRIAEELLRIGDSLPQRPGSSQRRVTPRTLGGLFLFLFLPIAASFWGEFAHGDDRFGVVLRALAVTLVVFVLVLAIALGSEAVTARRRRARAARPS